MASDGSVAARAALRTALAFPWPEPSSARGVVALGAGSTRSIGLRAAEVRRLNAETALAKRLLARRWPEAWVVALHESKRELARGLLEGADAAGRLSTEELVDLVRFGETEPPPESDHD